MVHAASLTWRIPSQIWPQKARDDGVGTKKRVRPEEAFPPTKKEIKEAIVAMLDGGTPGAPRAAR
eukprot:3988072-Prymnesium_polylepis.1